MLFSLKSKIQKATAFHEISKEAGFTLLELLISIVISSMVVSGLLYVVVEITQIDRREAALDRTQRDMQRAIDYMADDVKEAVFVYSDPTAQLADLDSDFPSGTPILAFWRTDPINDFPTDCSRWDVGGANASTAKYDECQVLQIRQASYSLVVYVQKERTSSDNIWKGASRIVRYELDKYQSPLADLNITPGYQDPTNPDVGFLGWRPTSINTAGSSAVLVDFVDTLPDQTITGTGYPCEDVDLGYQADPTKPHYSVVPASAITEQNHSFFACIRNVGTGGIEGSYSNQDAYLFLRGNAVDGAKGTVNAYSEASSLPTLKTRVLMRGVVNKNPT